MMGSCHDLVVHHHNPQVWLCNVSILLSDRLDDAAVALQKEKNMYKEIENYPMCFKVGYLGLSCNACSL